MRPLRELILGACFFLAAMIGTFVIGPILFIGPGRSYEENAMQLTKVLLFGPLIGGGLWLWFKYQYLTPRKSN